MTFDTSSTEVRIQMQKRLFAVLAGVPIALFYATDFGEYLLNHTGISRQVYALSLLGLYLFFYLYHIIVKSSFLYYCDDHSKIVIRFYQLNPFNPRKNSYEIPKSEFVKFSIKKSFFNLREEVFVYRKMRGNVAQYPPFSISSLSNNEKQKLLKSLSCHTQKQE